MGKPKYYLIILKKRNDTYDKVKKVEFKASETMKKIRFGSIFDPDTKTYNLDISKVSYTNDNRHFLFADYETGDTLTFNSYQLGASPKTADVLNATGLVATAMRMIGSNYGLAVLLIAAIAGLAFGFIIGQNIEGIAGAFK